MKEIIADFYPNKGQFMVNDPIEFNVEFVKETISIDNELTITITITITIYHMNQVILEISQNISLDNSKIKLITLPPMTVGGYGIELRIIDDEQIIQTCTTAFDVAKSNNELPRYGFLSDFAKSDEMDISDIQSMKKLHINIVQFYDWMYRHESLVSDENNYVDLMGKRISRTAVTNKIKMCHENGMKAMAYGAIYATSKEFYDKHPTWGLNNSRGHAITFIDIFYIMNISEESPWHQHIINEYKNAIEKLDFDGIHMDTYGFPKKGYSNDQKHETLIEMDLAFSALINHTKEQLIEIKDDVIIIFNNVGNWPVYATANTKQDMVYVEVWEPYNTYEDIQRIIREARNYTGKPIIISAYLKPFMYAKHEEAGYALKLMTACVVANGANHLIMGENQGILTQGYYVDYYRLEDELFAEIRKYYDFMIRYSELFYDQKLIDVSMTHAYGDNLEYAFSGSVCSPNAEPGKLWTIIREDKNTKLISLINLKGNDKYWNMPKSKTEIISELTIEIQLEKDVNQVWVTSPKIQFLESVPYQISDGERGRLLTLMLKNLDIWTVVVIKLCEWE